jgi:succinate dehydrogenase / fumarate reductase, membrane anchor subunit
MSLRTPLGRVLGLGAARDGVSHWWSQRLTAVALVPLTLWFVVSLARARSLDFEAMRAWLTSPLHSVATLLLVIVLCLHSRLGVQVVVEDYVHRPSAKLITLVLVDFVHFVLGAAGIYAILRVTFGAAS